jgi:hypothetical protein
MASEQFNQDWIDIKGLRKTKPLTESWPLELLAVYIMHADEVPDYIRETDLKHVKWDTVAEILHV